MSVNFTTLTADGAIPARRRPVGPHGQSLGSRGRARRPGDGRRRGGGAVGPASVFVGLRNSDESARSSTSSRIALTATPVIGAGTLNAVNGARSAFRASLKRTITMAVNGTPRRRRGRHIELPASARISCSVAGHRSGTARLWFNDAAANPTSRSHHRRSRPKTFHPRSANLLAPTQRRIGPRLNVERAVNSPCSWRVAPVRSRYATFLDHHLTDDRHRSPCASTPSPVDTVPLPHPRTRRPRHDAALRRHAPRAHAVQETRPEATSTATRGSVTEFVYSA